MGAHDHLDQMYARQRLLTDEAVRLEHERDALDAGGDGAGGANGDAGGAGAGDRRFILDIEIAALREEWSRISARISDVLERDLQR